jgi:tRNA-dihydrouridine synthase A
MFSVAPMIDWTDRHCRAFHRCFTRRTGVYTEMIVADALLYGPSDRLLAFSDCEHPIALQLGGSDPEKLARAAVMGHAAGYDEINLNVGCPSDRVQSGRFGACLMREPELVAACVAAMQSAVDIPVTVKCRIGVDEDDPHESLPRFIETVAAAGVSTFIVHARKAWLSGLSPKENREIPPLDYALVEAVKARWPQLTIVLNGGITTLEAAREALSWADGVMVGRAAYQTPGILGAVDPLIFGEGSVVSPAQALARYRPYMAQELARGTRLHAMTRHMMGFFHGQPGARQWRHALSTLVQAPSAGIEVLDAALNFVGRSGFSDAESISSLRGPA